MEELQEQYDDIKPERWFFEELHDQLKVAFADSSRGLSQQKRPRLVEGILDGVLCHLLSNSFFILI